MNSLTEENYLKAIYKLSASNSKASTTEIAGELKMTAGSVTDMVQKLADKKLLNYKKYEGVSLTKQGKGIALHVIRKHRLWEYFLVEKLNLAWNEVHEIAEQLEHINSQVLIEKLDEYLGHPKFDPHGDPIPDENGVIEKKRQEILSNMEENSEGIITGVKDDSAGFLKYLNEIGIRLGTHIKILKNNSYDKSMLINIDNKIEVNLSQKVSENLYLKIN